MLTDTSTAQVAIERLRRLHQLGSVPAHARKVRYDWTQLYDWRVRAAALFSSKSILTLDIDERGNRLTVGVRTPTDRSAVEAKLRALGLPVDGVRVEVQRLPELTTNLGEAIRPIPGGVAITNLNDGGGCTLGVTAQTTENLGFLTNAHCVQPRFVVDSTPFAQPFSGRIAREWVDPPTFPQEPCCGPTPYLLDICPPERMCRRSDAAYIAYDSSRWIFPWISDVGRIARTRARGWLSVNPDNGTIDDANPRFEVRGAWGYPSLGWVLNKVGWQSGWQKVVVTNTCIDMDYGDFLELCQFEGMGRQIHGDSGAPLFTMYNYNGEPNDVVETAVKFVGLAHSVGGDYVYFSPYTGIYWDFEYTMVNLDILYY